MSNLKAIGSREEKSQIFGSKHSLVAKPSQETVKKAKSIMEGKLNSFQDKIYKIQREEEYLKKHSIALQQNKNIPDIIKSPTASISMEDIDSIHEKMQMQLERGIPQLDEDLSVWTKMNHLPKDLKLLMNLAIIDQTSEEALEQEHSQREQHASSAAIQSREQLKLEELQSLCSRFGIDTQSLGGLTDKQLFQSFIFGDPASYYTYKHSSNVDRTLIKNNLKPKRLGASEKKTNEVLRTNEIDKKNTKKIIQLSADLKLLAEIDPPRYQMEVEAFEKVLFQHRIGKVEYVEALLKTLPDHYRPSTLAKTRYLKKQEQEQKEQMKKSQSQECLLQQSEHKLGLQQNAQLIHITDFSLQDFGSPPQEKQSTELHTNQPLSANSSQIVGNTDQPVQDLKLRDIHLKRRDPQLYLNEDVDVDTQIRGNVFNRVLKHSLVHPSRQRYVKTKHEREAIQRMQNLSLAKKKEYLNDLRKLSNSPQRTLEKRSLSMPKASLGPRTTRNRTYSIDPRQLAIHATSQQNDHGSLGNRFLNKNSSIGLSQMAIEQNEEQQRPLKKIASNIGLSGRFFRKMRPSPSEEGFQMPNSRQNVNSQERQLVQAQDLLMVPTTASQSPAISNQYDLNSVQSRPNEGSVDGVFMTHMNQSDSIESLQEQRVLLADSQAVPKATPQTESKEKQKLNDLISFINEVKGSNQETKIQKINHKVSSLMLQQRFRNQYAQDVADSIQEFSEQNPRVLRWLFDQQIETLEEDNQTQRRLIQEFEKRKLDTKYYEMLDFYKFLFPSYEMLEKREKANFMKSNNKKLR